MLRRPVSWLTSTALLLSSCASIPPQAQPMPVQVQGQDQVQLYSEAQLDSILAPIALYPDVLLTQVLMAAAFPPQVVEAGRWVQYPANRQYQGEALAQMLAPMDWDPSVKSLVPFPGVLAQLNGNQQWLEQLGYASAYQQADVLDSVQRLRHQAWRAGHLRSAPQYVVRQEARFIYIEPAQPNVIYVPAYNPLVVYGSWGYPAYPPVYLVPPQGYGWGPIVGAGLFFGTAIAVSALFWDLGRPHWHERRIFVNTRRYNTINVNRAPYRGGEIWHPRQATTYNNDVFRHHQPRRAHDGAPNQPPNLRGGRGSTGPSVVQPDQHPRMQDRTGPTGANGARPGQLPRGRESVPSQPPHLQSGRGLTGPSIVPPDQNPRMRDRTGANGARPGQPPLVRGAPGAAGRPDVSTRPDSSAPGQQPRVPGASGTAGHSGVPAPGLQPRVPGAPGTAGQSGVLPPSHQGGDRSGGRPSGQQGSSAPRGGEAPHAAPRARSPDGAHSARPTGGGPSGGGGPAASGQSRGQGGGNAAPPHDTKPKGGGRVEHGGGDDQRQDNKRE